MNEQLRRENDVLKTDVTQLRTNNDAMKGENKQLTTVLEKFDVNNDNQIRQINSQSSEIATMKDESKQLKTENDAMKNEIGQLKTEYDMIKAENVQLKIENDDLRACHVDTSRSLHPPPVHQRKHRLKVSQWSGIT